MTSATFDLTSSGAPRPFHLALRVHDLAAAEGFYRELLGAGIGRRSDRWIDFDLGGHQITVHLDDAMEAPAEARNGVDGDQVPVPHFGVVLDMTTWRALAERIRERAVKPIIGPRVRFEGEVGEQGTLFLRDPSGNALEFKGFRDMAGLFAT